MPALPPALLDPSVTALQAFLPVPSCPSAASQKGARPGRFQGCSSSPAKNWKKTASACCSRWCLAVLGSM